MTRCTYEVRMAGNTLVLLFLMLPFLGKCSNTAIQFYTIDTSPHDGLRRFLWSANVTDNEVTVLEKPPKGISDATWIIENIQSHHAITNVLYCNSKLLAVTDVSGTILHRWLQTGKHVLLELGLSAGILELKCILGETAQVIQVLKILEEIANSLQATDTVDKVIDFISKDVEFIVGYDTNNTVFLNMDRHPIDMIGYNSKQTKFHDFVNNENPSFLIGSLAGYNTFTRLTNYVPRVFNMSARGNYLKSQAKEYRPMSFYQPVADVKEYFKEDPSRFQLMVTALFIKEDYPLLDMILNRFKSIDWLSSQRVILIFNRLPHRDGLVNAFMKEHFSRKTKHVEIAFYNSSSPESRSNYGMHREVNRKCDEHNCYWIWSQDSNVMNVMFNSLQSYAMMNFSILSPKIISDINSDSPSVNFWGDTAANGYYQRSPDYFDLTEAKVGGLFAVPYAGGAHLVKAEVMKDLSYWDPDYRDADSDIVFCNSIRKSGHLLMLEADGSPDFIYINGMTNASVKYPLLEHFPENKDPFHLSYYMKYDHVRQRDWKGSDATPLQNPCEDVYVMETFTEVFANQVIAKASQAEGWMSRQWYKGWETLQTMALEDLNWADGWKSFSEDYLPTVIHRKYDKFRTNGTPIFSFLMKMTNETEPTEALEGKGVYTMLVALTDQGEGSSVLFNDVCKVDLKTGDFMMFPSRFTHRVRFVPPKTGIMMNLLAFYK